MAQCWRWEQQRVRTRAVVLWVSTIGRTSSSIARLPQSLAVPLAGSIVCFRAPDFARVEDKTTHTALITLVAWSPDGSRLVTADGVSGGVGWHACPPWVRCAVAPCLCINERACHAVP